MDREKGFVKALSQHRQACADVFSLIKDEEKAKIRRWEDERPSLELLLSSLNQTCDILKKEKKKLASELSAKQQSVSSSGSQAAKQGSKATQSSTSSHHGSNKEPALLQRELDELNSRVQATDIEIRIANEELASCERADEREYLSTKCVVLQDTRRILAEEMHALRSDLARLDASSRVEAERKRAEESGWAEVSRLEEQLERTTARLDRVKQQLYFPEAKGYRFSSGNGGIYVGARDLHVSEVSGRFEFTCEPIRPKRGVQPAVAPGVPAPPRRVARLTVALGGVSASTALAERSDSRRLLAQASLTSGGSADPLGRSAFPAVAATAPKAKQAPQQQPQGPAGGAAPNGSGGGAGGAGSSSRSSASPRGGGPGAVAEGVTGPGGGQDPSLLPTRLHTPRAAALAAQSPGGSAAAAGPAGSPSPSPRPSPGAGPGPPALRVGATSGPAVSPGKATSVGIGGGGSASGSAPSTPISNRQPPSPSSVTHPLATAAAVSHFPASPYSPATYTAGGSPVVAASASSPLWQHPQPQQPSPSQQAQPHPSYAASPPHPQPQPQPQPQLRPASSGPPGAGPPPEPSLLPGGSMQAGQHRRMGSHDVAMLGGGAATTAAAGTGGMAPLAPARGLPPPGHMGPTGRPPTMVSTAPPPPRTKGEAVAGFLSGLKNKREKLKNMVGGLVGDRDRDRAGGVGVPAAAGADPYGGGVDSSGGGGGGRLRSQVMEKLTDGFSESKDKLSRIGKAIAAKAPEAFRDMKTKMRRGGSGGGAGGVEDEWSEDGRPMPSFSPSSAAAGVVYPSQNLQPLQPYGGTDVPPLEFNTTAATTATLLTALDIDYFNTGGGSAVAAATAAAGNPTGAVAAVPSGAAAAAAAAPSQMGPRALDGSDGGEGGKGAGPGSSAGGGKAAGPGDQDAVAVGAEELDPDSGLLGGFVEDFECRPSRKGVYVQLLGERVELLGERGTKVPDMSIREIMLEVEVAVTAVFEYHSGGGGSGGGAWVAPELVSFNILQLDHRMRGNNIPLPRTLLKGLLNAYMPGVLTRLLSGLLPAELGAYTACSGETQALSGEFKVAGPSLSTTLTSMAPAPKPPSDPAKRAKWAAAQAAASRARAMLGLSDPQAAAVAELFGGGGRPSLVPESAGLTPNISGLCRFYVSYSQSSFWQPLVGVLDRALQTAFDFHGVRQADRFSLISFLEGPVARLVRKPLRIAFTIERLSLALDCDAALATVRDFFERLAREYEAKGPKRGSGGGGDEPSGPPREPLEVQLELLDLWHASLAKTLRAFKQRFRSGGATLLASADRRVFQFGAESVAYDGPLKLKFPLDLAMDPDGSFLIDVRLPDREQASNSITSLLTEVMYSLSTTHNANAAPAPGTSSTAFATVQQPPPHLQPPYPQQPQQSPVQQGPWTEPPSQASTVHGVMARAAAVQGVLSSAPGGLAGTAPAGSTGSLGGGGGSGADSPAAGASRSTGGMAAMASSSALLEIEQEWAAALAEGMPEGSALAAGTAPLLQNPVVGQLCVKKLALNLRLDEERIVELLAGRGAATALSSSSSSATTISGSHPQPHGQPHGHPQSHGGSAVDPRIASGPHGHPSHGHGPSSSTTSSSSSNHVGADIAGRLLGCYGDLFTASLDMGWRPDIEADGAAARPCCMMTVASNDITRLRAEVEGLWFQSSVSPRLAVRVLQAVVIALVLKFHSADSYSIRFWNRAFNHLYEYLSRGSLDVAVCLSMRATMDRPTDRLRVELSGQDLNAGASAGGGVGGGSQGLLGRVCPVYLLNDVNLMTVLDSVKLLSETGAQQQQQQQQ